MLTEEQREIFNAAKCRLVTVKPTEPVDYADVRSADAYVNHLAERAAEVPDHVFAPLESHEPHFRGFVEAAGRYIQGQDMLVKISEDRSAPGREMPSLAARCDL